MLKLSWWMCCSASSEEVMSDFQEISGGPYIYVPVERQEQVKKEATLENFRKLSHVEDVASKFDTFISSPNHFHIP